MDPLEPFVVEDDPAPDPMYEERARELDDAAIGMCEPIDAEPSPAAPSGEIQVFDPSTGVVTTVIDAKHILACAGLVDPACEDVDAALGDAPFAGLVTFASQAAALLAVVREADNRVREELPFRLDRRSSWTVREAGHTINAPSPEAGTTAYNSELLRDALAALVAGQVIEQEAADRALEVVTPPARVSYALLRELLDALHGGLDMPVEERLRGALHDLLAKEPEPALVQKHAGIKALCKLAAAREAIEACQVELTPPVRRATVKPILRSS